MKKTVFLLPVIVLCFFSLSACTPTSFPNILLFTDELNRVSEEKTELGDYSIFGDEYKLLFESEFGSVLLVATENENGEIKKIRLSLSKADANGKLTPLSEAHTLFYKQKITEALEAFTFFEKEKCIETAERILPSKSEDFLKTGELTMDSENFHIIYYSNKICCQFTVINTFLEEPEPTEKPVSRPLYGVTANIAAED